jgi:hypothetical protein
MQYVAMCGGLCWAHQQTVSGSWHDVVACADNPDMRLLCCAMLVHAMLCCENRRQAEGKST